MAGEQLVATLKKAALIFVAGGAIICLCGSFESPWPRSEGEWLVRFGASGLTALFVWGLTSSAEFRRGTLGVLVWLILTTVLVVQGMNDWLSCAIGIVMGIAAAWALARVRLRSGYRVSPSALANESGRQWRRDQAGARDDQPSDKIAIDDFMRGRRPKK